MEMIEFKVIEPEDPHALPCPMKKFVMLTEDWLVSFVVKDKLDVNSLKEHLNFLDPEDGEEIIKLVKSYYSEEEIGKAELSEIASVAKIKRLLPNED